MPVIRLVAAVALVRVLCPDVVRVAARDEGKLGEAAAAGRAPVFEDAAVPVVFAWS